MTTFWRFSIWRSHGRRGSVPRHAAILGLLACGEAFEPVPCEEGYGLLTEQGECRGVELATLCGGRTCVPAEAACDRVHDVGSQADLDAAAAEARSGECLALAAGEYGPTAIRGGVSVLGRGAAHVTIEGDGDRPALAVTSGAGGMIRGVRLRGGDHALRVAGVRGLLVTESWIGEAEEVSFLVVDAEVRARAVRIGGPQDGPSARGAHVFSSGGEGGEVRFEAAWIDGNGTEGVVATGGGSVEILDSLVENNGNYGVALCGGESRVARTAVRRNGGVGVLAGCGARVELRDVDVSETRLVDTVGRLLEAQGDAQVEIAGDSRLHDSEHIGVLVDASRLSMESGEVSGNERGLWIQQVTGDQVADGWAVRLRDVEVAGNVIAGLGATGARGVVVERARVTGTTFDMIVSEGETIIGGEGVLAVEGSQVLVEASTIEGNERAQVVLDDSPDSDVRGSVVSSSGGEAVGIIVQNMPVPEDHFAGSLDAKGAAVEPVVPETPLEVVRAPADPAPGLDPG